MARVVTYSKTSWHARASQAAAAESMLYFRCFLAINANSLTFAASNLQKKKSVTKATKLLFFPSP